MTVTQLNSNTDTESNLQFAESTGSASTGEVTIVGAIADSVIKIRSIYMTAKGDFEFRFRVGGITILQANIMNGESHFLNFGDYPLIYEIGGGGLTLEITGVAAGRYDYMIVYETDDL